MEPKFKDAIISEAEIRFSFLDKLRILCGKIAHVTAKTKTENVVGAVQPTSWTSWVEPIFPKKPEEGALHVPDAPGPAKEEEECGDR